MDAASMRMMRKKASRLAADRSERGFREAVKLWTQLSDEGCPESMCELASCHGQGEGGCVQNWGRAVELFRAAAIKGYRLAQCNLGCRYAQGEVPGETGTERFATAVFWWEFRGSRIKVLFTELLIVEKGKVSRKTPIKPTGCV
jgi:TPR repeat protein